MGLNGNILRECQGHDNLFLNIRFFYCPYVNLWRMLVSRVA